MRPQTFLPAGRSQETPNRAHLNVALVLEPGRLSNTPFDKVRSSDTSGARQEFKVKEGSEGPGIILYSITFSRLNCIERGTTR